MWEIFILFMGAWFTMEGGGGGLGHAPLTKASAWAMIIYASSPVMQNLEVL